MIDRAAPSADALLAAMERGETTAVEVVRDTLDRIARLDPSIHAFITIMADDAMTRAVAIDRLRQAGEPLGRLAGLPVAVKDNILVRGFPTTCGAEILSRFVAPYDAHVVERSRAVGLGPEVRRRIELGTFVLSAGYHEAYYMKAARVRRRIKEAFDRLFESVDAIVTPTSPFTAFKLGERLRDPLAMYACDALTVSANLAGLPAISVPSGAVGRLPVGLQIIGRPFEEATLLRLASALEAA